MLDSTEQYCINQVYMIRPTIASYDFPFRIVSTGYVTADFGFYTRRTDRPEAFLIYTVSGTGKMTWHGETVDLLPQSACLIHCNDYQYYCTTSNNEPWVHYYVHFDGSGLKAYAPCLLDKLRALYPIHQEIFLDRFEFLQKNKLRNDPLSNSQANLLITTLLNELVTARYDLSAPEIDESYDAILSAYDYINHNFMQPITIEQLCEVSHLSKYYFIHLFKKVVGESPYQNILRHRINYAKRLLVCNDCSIDEISHLVGFPNYSNFINQFKKMTGITPNQYKNAVVTLDYGRKNP